VNRHTIIIFFNDFITVVKVTKWKNLGMAVEIKFSFTMNFIIVLYQGTQIRGMR
jgi:hypothetical protein